jgi:uncharacterized protein
MPDKDAFSRVTSVIHYLISQGIRTMVRVNISRINTSRAEEIIKFLREEYGSGIIPYFYPLFKSAGNVSFSDGLSEEDMEREMPILCEILYRYGYRTTAESMIFKKKSAYCNMKTMNHIVIDPLGDLYKCQNMAGDKKYCIGNIERGLAPSKFLNDWCDWHIDDRCRTCKFLPVCQGGCEEARHSGCKTPCLPERYEMDKRLEIIYDIYENASRGDQK